MPTGVSGTFECENEDCDSMENVKTFVFYDGRKAKRLCWDCRWPIIKERAKGAYDDDPDPSGQQTLGAFT